MARWFGGILEVDPIRSGDRWPAVDVLVLCDEGLVGNCVGVVEHEIDPRGDWFQIPYSIRWKHILTGSEEIQAGVFGPIR